MKAEKEIWRNSRQVDKFRFPSVTVQLGLQTEL
jgi:hypothetical protein